MSKVLLAVTLTAEAIAQSTDDLPDRTSEQWRLTDHRARGVYTAGLIAGVGGLGLEVLGYVTDSSDVQTIGLLGELASPPMMAGASLRSARALREQGVPVGNGPGYASWGLWSSGVLLALSSADERVEGSAMELELTGLGCRVTAYVMAVLQSRTNARGRRSRWQVAGDDQERLQLTVTPMLGHHRAGVIVSTSGFE